MGEQKTPVSITPLPGGGIARVALHAGKGNVVDSRVIGALTQAFREVGEDRAVKAVVLTAEGSDFSFGASVPEHAPGRVDDMLPAFHALFRAMDDAAVPVIGAVRGRCLGGGFEIAIACHRLVVAEDAQLGVPEVTLGVFPPVAAALLPLRTGQPVVDRLVIGGELIDGVTAVSLGVAEHCCEAGNVDDDAIAYAERFVKLSGAAVRFATRAARAAWREALDDRLARLEKLYLEELMRTADAREGIAAFLERRKPTWRNA